MATKSESKYMCMVAELGCLICNSPAQIHHCFTYMGGGRDHSKIIPLCHIHHQNGGYGIALHAGKKAFEEKYGTEEYLVAETKKRLN